MDLITRYKNGGIDVTLSILQVLFFFCFTSLLITSALLYRHFSEDALVPALEYLASVKLALPPLLVLIVTYAYAFFTGEHISSMPKNAWSWLINVALQSKKILSTIFVLTIIFTSISGAILAKHTPPYYEKLSDQLLTGDNDDHLIIQDAIKNIKDKNQKLAESLEIVKNVFEERRLRNHENKPINSTIERMYIRALESNENEIEIPLKKMALAEAYSMLLQSLEATDNLIIKDLKQSEDLYIAEKCAMKSIEIYQSIIDSNSNLVTDTMRLSATQNIGNVYYYSKKFNSAIQQYNKVSHLQFKASTYANMVASYAYLGKFNEALDIGKNAIDKARSEGAIFKEMRDYVSLLTNTGFLYLITEDNVKAYNNLKESFDLIPDPISYQNLALALIANKRYRNAIKLLENESEAPEVTQETELEIVKKAKGGNCTYLIRGIALLNINDPQSVTLANANFAAYMMQPHVKLDFETTKIEWRKNAMNALNNDPRPCGSLSMLSFVKNTLLSKE